MSIAEAHNIVHEDLLERLMTQYGSSLYRMCYLYLRDAGLAEDAVQDTFIKAHRSFDQFRGDSSERSWLMRIAINTCKDYHRTAWFRLVDRRISPDALPQASSAIRTSDDTVLAEVMRLASKDKDVILLRYYQDMSLAEIAQTLGIPQQTVSSRLQRAKAKLYRKLERWYFDEE